jgi:ATP:corrinoid adenosyltransferase
MKMAKKKAARDKIMATKEGEKGLIIVHTGAGKGKSSSAFGMILRCIAHGMPCAVVQFIKGAWSTGERTADRANFGRSLPVPRDGRGLHLGNPGQGTRHRRRPKGLGKGQGADP